MTMPEFTDLVNTLVAHMNEAHLAKSEEWSKVHFHSADISIGKIIDAYAVGQEEVGAAREEIERLKVAITPQPPPEGLVPHGHMLEPTRINAEFWYKAGHSEEAKAKGESIICMAQAVFAWKNAAYSKAEDCLQLQEQLAQAQAEIAQWKESYHAQQEDLLAQLVAKQAENEMLREALEFIYEESRLVQCGEMDRQSIQLARTKVFDALATLSDNSALREHDAKLVERLATDERCKSGTYQWLMEIAAQIRKGEWK